MTTKARRDEPMSATRDDADAPGSGERDVAADPAHEVFLRSGDSDKQDGRFRRNFRIPAHGYDMTDEDDLHRRNSLVVLQEAIQQGVHPLGDVTFDGATEQSPDETGYDPRYPLVELRYSVASTPAGIHADASETRTPGIVLREDMHSSTESDKSSSKGLK